MRVRHRRLQRFTSGLLLLPLFWCLFALFAFGPFDRETPAQIILTVTGAVWAAVVVLLAMRRLIGLETLGGLALAVAAMIGFYSIPLRGDLPPDLDALNRRISASHEDRYEYAREAFRVVVRSFTGPTREYLLQPQRIFLLKDAGYYWETRGYVPSHLLAQLYRKLLLASGRFDETEVVYRTGRCYNSPHGYVVIRHPRRSIYADIWAAQNIDAYRFGQLVEMPSCDALAKSGPQGEPYEAANTPAGAQAGLPTRGEIDAFSRATRTVVRP
ncbi:MAG: hypothetical protein ACRD2J_00335 [Thermoanaerobaculia bacterium]